LCTPAITGTGHGVVGVSLARERRQYHQSVEGSSDPLPRHMRDWPSCGQLRRIGGLRSALGLAGLSLHRSLTMAPAGDGHGRVGTRRFQLLDSFTAGTIKSESGTECEAVLLVAPTSVLTNWKVRPPGITRQSDRAGALRPEAARHGRRPGQGAQGRDLVLYQLAPACNATASCWPSMDWQGTVDRTKPRRSRKPFRQAIPAARQLARSGKTALPASPSPAPRVENTG